MTASWPPPLVVEHAGCALHAWRQGSGPPVLWIQGTGVGARGWAPQLDALAPRWEGLAWDHRGFGQSQPVGAEVSVAQLAQDARVLLDAVGWERAHVVGHSLGGLVALELARQERARVRSLALLCTFATGAVPLRPSWSVLWPGLRSKIGSLRARRQAFLELVLTPDEHAAPDPDTRAELLGERFGHDLAQTPPVVMAQMRAMGRCDLSGVLPSLEGLPTLVLSAQHDRLAPPWAGEALAAGIPGARFVLLEGAAHAVPVTQPERVNAALESFWAEIVA